MKRLLTALFLLLLTACISRPIETSRNVLIPTGMTQEQIEVAIIAAISSDYIAARLLSDLLGDAPSLPTVSSRYRVDRSQQVNYWYFAGEVDGAILADYRRGSMFLRVKIIPSGKHLEIRIIDSRNVRRDLETGTIHKNVYGWINRLEENLTQSLAETQLLVTRTRRVPIN